MSNDHKPCVLTEKMRIKSKNGRVEPYQGKKYLTLDENGIPIGPARVWLKDQNLPGLAMSRSFGDKVAATVGIISEPEIIEHLLGQEDKFIVLASDGLWEFMESEEVVRD